MRERFVSYIHWMTFADSKYIFRTQYFYRIDDAQKVLSLFVAEPIQVLWDDLLAELVVKAFHNCKSFISQLPKAHTWSFIFWASVLSASISRDGSCLPAWVSSDKASSWADFARWNVKLACILVLSKSPLASSNLKYNGTEEKNLQCN